MVLEKTEKKQWMVFLCHCEEDQPFAERLYNRLLSLGITVWFEEHEIMGGDSTLELTQEGIKGSELVVVVISKNAAKSHLLKAMLDVTINQQIEEKETVVIPVSIDGTDPKDVFGFLEGKEVISIAPEGSEKQFNKLMNSIVGQYKRHHATLPIALSRLLDERSATEYPYGLHSWVPSDNFIVPGDVVKTVARDITEKQSVWITAARLMGKTSFLKYLRSEQCQAYYQYRGGIIPNLGFADLDILELAGKSCNQLFIELAHKISVGVNEQIGAKSYEQALNSIKTTVNDGSRGEWLWILFMDNFDQIFRLKGANKAFFDRLNSLASNNNLRYVVTSRSNFLESSLPADIRSSGFFTLFKRYPLTLWDPSTIKIFMYSPYGNQSALFTEADLAYITRLTARHPLLLQIACDHLLRIRRKSKDKENSGEYDKLLGNFMTDARMVYDVYWDEEIGISEHNWLGNLWRALSRKGDEAVKKLQMLALDPDNDDLRERLIDLGLLLDDSNSLQLPLGFEYYLRKKVEQ